MNRVDNLCKEIQKESSYDLYNSKSLSEPKKINMEIYYMNRYLL